MNKIIFSIYVSTSCFHSCKKCYSSILSIKAKIQRVCEREREKHFAMCQRDGEFSPELLNLCCNFASSAYFIRSAAAIKDSTGGRLSLFIPPLTTFTPLPAYPAQFAFEVLLKMLKKAAKTSDQNLCNIFCCCLFAFAKKK